MTWVRNPLDWGLLCSVSRFYFSNRAALWSWHAHDQLWGEPKPHIHLLPDFVAWSDFRRDLSSPIKYHLCWIQACLATHSTFVYMFNHLWHNRLASTLGQGLSCAMSHPTSFLFPINMVHMSWRHPKSLVELAIGAHSVIQLIVAELGLIYSSRSSFPIVVNSC